MGNECADTLKSANNILAVEYLKQLNITGSRIESLTVKRYGTGYLDKECYNNIASASAIREVLGKSGRLQDVSDVIPPATFQVFKELNEGVNIGLNDFYPLLIYQILISDPVELGNIISATEGLEHRVKKAAISSVDTNSLIRSVLSKRYTQTRIQRLLVHILLGLNKDSFRNIINKDINYARVLAISSKGALLLKHIKKENLNTIPILTNINREISKDSSEWDLLKYDVLASDIYNLIAYREIYTHSDYIMKPFVEFNSKMEQ